MFSYYKMAYKMGSISIEDLKKVVMNEDGIGFITKAQYKEITGKAYR